MSAQSQKVQFKIGGMACSFCVASITKALARMEGVRDVNVNRAHEETLIEYEPIKVGPAKLKATLLDLGYTVRDARGLLGFEEEEAEIRDHLENLLTAAAYTAVALGAMALLWLDLMPPRGMAAMFWLMPILALSTIFGPGWRILTMAWASLRSLP
jgi:cation transport ATPase